MLQNEGRAVHLENANESQNEGVKLKKCFEIKSFMLAGGSKMTAVH